MSVSLHIRNDFGVTKVVWYLYSLRRKGHGVRTIGTKEARRGEDVDGTSDNTKYKMNPTEGKRVKVFRHMGTKTNGLKT